MPNRSGEPAGDGWLVIAEIGPPHGLRGEVVARLSGVDADTLIDLADLRLVTREGAEHRTRVLAARPKKAGWILALDGVRDRSMAEALRGAEIRAARETLPDPEDDEWYIVDLVGLTVVTEEGRELGRLDEVLQLPANDVFVVRGEAGEVLLPVTDEVVRAVDMEVGRVVVHLLPGLVDEPEGEA